jgi:hypothetical protein
MVTVSGRAILGDRLLEVTPCGGLVALLAKQKIDRVTSFIDGPVQVFPFILDLEWSKKQGVVELFPCFSSPNRTCTSQRIRLSIEVSLIAKATSA